MTPSQDFLLNAMRAAALRARLMEQDLKTIGMSLSAGLITLPEALKWLEDVGAMPLIGSLPLAVTKAAEAVESGQKAIANGAKERRA